MASSVSSERAFSQGGITISKHRNRLKGDIVEALQCVKCSLRHDLLFRDPAPSSLLEATLDEDGSGEEGEEEPEGDKDSKGWDDLLIDSDEDDDDEDGSGSDSSTDIE
jgi:hypothetical protein